MRLCSGKRSGWLLAIGLQGSAWVGPCLASEATEAAADATRPRSFSISWLRMHGAESCISTRGLANAVEERLQHRVFVSATRADLFVEGRVERREDEWQASLITTDASGAVLGKRTLQSSEASCDELSQYVVMAVSLMIDPEIELPPPSAELPSPTSPAAVSPASPTAASPSPVATEQE